MDKLPLTLDDLAIHVVTIGVDVFPPIEIASERTRLNMFYEEACNRWKDMFERIVASESEFTISKTFKHRPEIQGQAVECNTFALTNRGPVFIFPLRLPDPTGVTDLESDYRERFKQIRQLFFSAILERKVMRVGLVREVILSTGETPYLEVLSDEDTFSGAKLVGGNLRLQYRDDKCNVIVQIEPAEIMKTTKIPVGQPITQRQSYGLRVRLDVNNAEILPLSEDAIEEVLDRADSFWPDVLLDYVNGRRM